MNINLLRRFIVILLCPLACSTGTAASSSADAAPAGGDKNGSPPGAGDGDATLLPDGGIANASTSMQLMAPGLYLVDRSVKGSGACAATTLGNVLDAIGAAVPSLADITTIYNPTQQGGGDGNFIYPYQTGDGGFAVAYKRGAGDCPAGCTDNTYDYFQTDDACAPQQVGHYHASSGTCLQVDGAPMWGHPPPPPDPSMVCGADNTPLDISGTYTFRAQGQTQSCAVSSNMQSSNAVDTTVMITVVQSQANPASGVVLVTGTGSLLVDGVKLPAHFIRRRFEAALEKSNLPSNCPQESSVMAQYDFENALPGMLTVTQFGDSNCLQCKGGLTLTLAPPNAGK